MSFGYSVGDVIAGANLTYRLLRIMADTKGASAEYLEAMSELSAMQQAFLQISQIRSHEMLPPATVNAASHIVLSSMDTIAKFLERTKHYQRLLEDPRASTFQSSWYKVGWTLYKSHELCALKEALHSRLTSVQVLLSAASYCTPLPTTVARYQVVDQEPHAPSISEPSLAPSSPPEGKNAHDGESDTAEDNPKGPEPLSPPPEQNDRTIPASESGSTRRFIHFKDAVGRKFKFPWDMAKKWGEVEDLIKQAFLQVDVLGPHVMEGHYDLIGPGGTIILPSIWEEIVEPEMSITMTMWPMDKMPGLPRPRVPGPRPLPPAGWELRPDPSGRPHFVDHNTGPTHRNPPDYDIHRSFGATAAPPPPPPMPSTPHPPVPGQAPTPGEQAVTHAGSRGSHRRLCQPGDAGDSRDLDQDERLWFIAMEFERHFKERDPDAITRSAVIEIVKDMKEQSIITRAESKRLIKTFKSVSLDSFKDHVSGFRAEISAKKAGSERSSSRDSSRGSAPGPASSEGVWAGFHLGKPKNNRHEGEDYSSEYSTEGQDDQSTAPTSDSEEWEDATEDEESIAEDQDGDYLPKHAERVPGGPKFPTYRAIPIPNRRLNVRR